MKNKTFEKAYLEYLEYAKLQIKPTTILSLKLKIEKQVLPYFGKIKIKKIDSKKYLEWQKEIEKKGYSYRYKRNLHYCVKNVYEYLEKFYDIPNIPKKVGNFKSNYSVKEYYNTWNEIEVKKFLSSIDNIEYYTLFNLLITTGCRKGELLALTFNDIKENYLYINKTITKELFNGKRLITTPKTKKSIRKILIDENLIKNINELKEYYKTKYENFNNNFYIFGAIEPIPCTTLERKKNYYCDKAKVKRITIHEFRHTNATILFKNKIEIELISQRLGHSNINTTLSTYIHTNTENEKKVAELLSFIKT